MRQGNAFFAVVFTYGMFQHDSIVMMKKILQMLLKIFSVTVNA